MKIAFIVPSLAKMGPVKVVYELVKEYKKMGLTAMVYYFDEKEGFEFPCPTKRINFFETFDFDEYDIVHTHGIRPDAYVFFHKQKIKRAKCITTLHNYVKKDLSYQYNAFVSLVFSFLWNIVTLRHNAIVVLSCDAKKYYLQFWYNKNIHVVYNGIELFQEELNMKRESDETIELGAIGLLTRRKGFDQAIRAVAMDKRLRLTIVGDGKERKNLENLTKELKLTDRVRFLGYQQNADRFLNQFDIFVMPSRAEGFPIALLEAARAKKCVVCSDIPIHKEVFSSDEVSFFQLENIDDLKQAILYAYDHKEELEHNIFIKFKNHYTSRIMAKNYVDLYETIEDAP